MLLGRVGKVFNFRAGGVAQMIGCLPSKYEAHSLNLSTTLNLVSEKQTLKTNKQNIS
jgi:hypothetical protein